MNKNLTIVIPCKNEGEGIVNVLKLLGKQKLDCQIIIADSSDDMKSFDILYNYMNRSPRTIKLINGGLPGVARNNGAKLVKTPYVLFMDADIYITDFTLINDCLAFITANDLDLVTCKFRTVGGKYNWVYRLFDIIQHYTKKTRPFAVGGFMLFKTETFKKLGGFNEEDKVAEDYHLSSQIKPEKFAILDRHVNTPIRRFESKGIWYMIKLAVRAWFNKNNSEWFKKSHIYWK